MQPLAPDAFIVILTGAGISKESGLDTFRCEGGTWSKVRIEDVATPEGYRRNPILVQEFYNARREGLRDAEVQPNAAHLALARLEREWTGEVLLITQNIDDLHERAGSSNLIHMHGELLKIRCENCGQIHIWAEELSAQVPCPSCHIAGQLRPHIVWFGEIPLEMERIFDALGQCDLFVSIGTSGNVYPAAGFVEAVRYQGVGQTLELNLDPSERSSVFEENRLGLASVIVPEFVAEILR